ncbi:hypothetical protein SPI_03664 [Niveomyces insectorum RCEF 264]|uniref:Glycosyl transferase, family 8 n=1 Tax=Niveomyces insectorum RCEF 264 TaxID=1081102 RepID=A0A167W9E7_9HYPO|nr:hypothetical protein SPI_03664 [Niveomyces insectorum RCEF 264]
MLLGVSSRRRFVGGFLFVVAVVLLFLWTQVSASAMTTFHEKVIRPATDAVKDKLPDSLVEHTDGNDEEKKRPHPHYKPTPTYTPPPVRDPFPMLAATPTPPPVPAWNRPRDNLHTEYGLTVAPPLLIGFTRSWPILLQAVVSYITAGWPPAQIYVVENTGVQQANARGQLTLQNPFFLNHTALQQLGVNIIQTPVLLTFAQLQNFYLSLTYARNWPYYFWSHMDVLTLSYEEGLAGVTPRYDEPGYKTVYELCCTALQEALLSGERWGLRFFAYDHLALVNPAAYEDVGGWDTLIPYYLTDCDMHTRLLMANWSAGDRRAGIVTDVNTVLEDLAVLYRLDDAGAPDFVDPNPPVPEKKEDDNTKKTKAKRRWEVGQRGQHSSGPQKRQDGDAAAAAAPPAAPLRLRDVSDRMFHYKHGERGRNTWQAGQKGGFGEKFYYPAQGIAEGIDIITEAGREVYRRKWGHRDCDLIDAAGLQLWDQWMVEKDWEK